MERERKMVDLSDYRIVKLIDLDEEVNTFGNRGGFAHHKFYEMSMEMAPELAREVQKLRDHLNCTQHMARLENNDREENRELREVVHWLAQEVADKESMELGEFGVPSAPSFDPQYWVDLAYKAVRNEKLENE